MLHIYIKKCTLKGSYAYTSFKLRELLSLIYKRIAVKRLKI